MSVQYTANLNGCKKFNFQFIFLIFSQNIDSGYTLEPPHFIYVLEQNKKNNVYPCKP